MKKISVRKIKGLIKRESVKTLRDLAILIRNEFAPRRRFSLPTYISVSTSARREYCDAFAELIETKDSISEYVTSCSNKWPVTKTALQEIRDRNDYWAAMFGVAR